MKVVGSLYINIALILTLGFLTACSDVRLELQEKPPISVQSTGDFCLSDPLSFKSYTKYLFVVDKSGSNRNSDNGGNKRADNIRKFIESKRGVEGIMWGLLGFGASAGEVEAYIKEPNGEAKFTDDTNEAISAVDKMQGESDNGDTPYRNALTATRQAIQKDREKFPDEKNFYLVFFISDGVPNDGSTQSDLNRMVEEIVDVAPNVIVSTAYYGDEGNRAIDRLREMAEHGNGKFINFENSEDWDFNDLVPDAIVQPWLLKKFLVYNVNAGYCIDGSIGTDSDADGMCDKDELMYKGFDPANRFSFGDGYGDFFHWRKLIYGETLPKCNDRSDEDFDLLTACEEKYIENIEAPEGVPKNGDPKNPDTDRDGILDGIETFVYFASTLAFAMDNTNLAKVPFDREEDAETQIDEHRSPLVRDRGAIAYDTRLERNPFDGQRDCFNFTQNILPLYPTLKVKKKNTLDWLAHDADGNMVLVYYIQTPKNDPSSNGVLRYSYQNLKRDPIDSITLGPGAGLKVRDSVFKTYEAPEK